MLPPESMLFFLKGSRLTVPIEFDIVALESMLHIFDKLPYVTQPIVKYANAYYNKLDSAT